MPMNTKDFPSGDQVASLKATFLGGPGRPFMSTDAMTEAMRKLIAFYEATAPASVPGIEGYQIIVDGKIVPITEASWHDLARAAKTSIEHLELLDEMAQELRVNVERHRNGLEPEE
ncbi:hypothetical protein CcrC1_gp392 [Caulobacter phage C1]|nr:hypothetical protein CcrC1_gp392 [Caulobacter phage C1]UTU08621.1 hypothetical protein CcrC2_gp393 [Caulobacter phage C2]UTU09136.1 hypothetical protein CcrJ4_gp387 [Caulobacter phage J4]UTU10254.1 hypothetical protein CcrRB23_gp392 [Caulobacter phage RB23]WGN97288.1 hypothetical protein [Bertelyvirus sp.]